MHETRLRHILKAAATFEADIQGRCVWVSRKWSEVAGLPLTDALGHGWVAAIYPEDLFNVTDEWDRAVREGNEFGPIVYRVLNHHTRRVTKVRGEATPVRDANDKIVGWVGSIEPFDFGSIELPE